MPNGNDEGALLDNDKIPFSSVAIASPIYTVVRCPDASIKTSSGTIIVGFTKSLDTRIFGGFSYLASDTTSRSDFISELRIDSSLTVREYSSDIGVENF